MKKIVCLLFLVSFVLAGSSNVYAMSKKRCDKIEKKYAREGTCNTGICNGRDVPGCISCLEKTVKKLNQFLGECKSESILRGNDYIEETLEDYEERLERAQKRQ